MICTTTGTGKGITNLSQFLKGYVAGRGTQQEAADKIGVTRPALARLLNGDAELSLDMAMKMEAAFPDLPNARELLRWQLDIQLSRAGYRFDKK